MTKSRTILAALCGAIIAVPALADGCLRPEERAGLDVRALRTYLMVSALQCRTSEPYNQFIRRYGSELSSADRAANAHFARTYGGQGRTRFDAYTTTLANEHSEDAIRGGGFFCRDAEPLFRQALSTPAADLAKLAVERNIPQSYTAAECGATTPQRTAARGRSTQR